VVEGLCIERSIGHPDAVITDFLKAYDGENKFALIRDIAGSGESKVARGNWMENEQPS